MIENIVYMTGAGGDREVNPLCLSPKRTNAFASSRFKSDLDRLSYALRGAGALSTTEQGRVFSRNRSAGYVAELRAALVERGEAVEQVEPSRGGRPRRVLVRAAS